MRKFKDTEKVHVVRVQSDYTVMYDIVKNDVTPDLFQREFTQNAIEAGATSINWGCEVVGGVNKLTIRDNGCGMSPAELVRFIGGAMSSGKEIGATQNFGLGAKNSTLKYNSHGTVWISRKEVGGPAYAVKLYFKDGSIVISDPVEHATAWKGRGTQVIFLGKSDEDVTFHAPGSKKNELSANLNERYYTLPKGVSITYQESEGDKKQNRSVRGYRAILEMICDTQDPNMCGVTEVEGANIHWFILSSSELPKTLTREIPKSFQRVVMLHKNELYGGRMHGRIHNTSLQTAGILGSARDRIVLLVEPTGDVVPNMNRVKLTDRTLSMDLGPDMFLSEFRDKHPEPLRQFLRSIQGESLDSTTSRDFMARAVAVSQQCFGSFTKPAKTYKPSADGRTVTGDVNDRPGGPEVGTGEGGNGPNNGNGDRKDLPSNPTSGNTKEVRKRKGGQKVKAVSTEALQSAPQFNWDPSLQDSPLLAGTYCQDSNVVQMNTNYQGYQWMLNDILKNAHDKDLVRAFAEENLQGEITMAVTQIVYQHKSMQGQDCWEAPLSPREITAAISLIHIRDNVVESLNRRFGRINISGAITPVAKKKDKVSAAPKATKVKRKAKATA